MTAGWTVVHDFAFVRGGAESVTATIADDVLDGAPVLLLGGDEQVVRSMELRGPHRYAFPPALVRPTAYRAMLPVWPRLAERVVVDGDAVCSSYAFAHHVQVTGRKVVYCHSPLRQVWSGQDLYQRHGSRLERAALSAFAPRLRRADVRAAASADAYVATSTAVRDRVSAYYGLRDVPVISPPVDTTVFRPSPTAERTTFLFAGRIIEPYKRLEMTIEAVRGLDATLLVAGDGRDRARLEAVAPPNVRFLGWQGRHELAALYQQALAVVFPSEDDFGLVPVESMACGTPAVALRAGGASETVVDGVTGVFFDEPTPAALRRALVDAAGRRWDHAAIAEHAQRYSVPGFVARMRGVLDGNGGATPG